VPTGPVTADFVDLLNGQNPAVFSCIRPDGSPLSSVVWFLRDGDRILLTFDAARKRLDFLRENPACSLTILDREDMYRYVSLSGRVVELAPDTLLEVADQSSLAFLGKPYFDRQRERVVGVFEWDTWFGWNAASQRRAAQS
jgi:PPOX class probable F420-dependent enzyme